MIFLKNKGRLGNQLFIYALALELKSNYPNEEIIIDNSEIDSFGFSNDLLQFKTKNFKYIHDNSYKRLSFIQKILIQYYNLISKKYGYEKKYDFEKGITKIYSHFGLVIHTNGYIPYNLHLKDKCYFNGYFQSTRYFNDVQKELRKDIVPKNVEDIKNTFLYKKIVSENSICVTIRRGDFLKYKVHNVCGETYFEKGISLITSMVDNPVFFAFSDDIDWVKKNIKFDFPVYYESGNDNTSTKLFLMYSCKHFIISNSTFSWWASYLSEYKDKIIISPDKWYNENVPCDLFQPNWIKISCNDSICNQIGNTI